MSTKNEQENALFNIFLEEAREILNVLTSAIRAWGLDLSNKKYCVELKGELHTLKGGARMVNQAALSMLAQELEELCQSILDENLNADQRTYGLICAKFDQLNMLVNTIHVEKPKVFADTPDIEKTVKKQPILLVVDDSLTIRTVTKHFLEENHYAVITAQDGIEALEQLHRVTPDLILLDVEMPRMDGFQFAKKMREISEFAHIPIIMITFCTGQEARNKAEKLGIKKFMGKPYDENDLLKAIKNLLDKNLV